MRFRKARLTVIAPVFLLVCSTLMAQGECDAEVIARYVGQDVTKDSDFIDHVIAVDVTTKDKCAKVSYILEVVEEYPDGEQRTKRKEYVQRVRSSDTKTRKLTYRLHRKTLVESWKIEKTGCTHCSS